MIASVWIYTIISVFIVSLISLIGILTISLKGETLKKILLYMVSFSAGSLFGNAFIHLLPEVAENSGFGLKISLFVLSGVVIFFIVEKIICWRHCHILISEEHPHPFAYMNLIGDSVHNFIDGLIIGGSYLSSIPLGITTTLTVIFHEIPQEIGDFGILLHGNFTKTKALVVNFITALTSVLGAIFSLLLNSYVENLTTFIVPFAAGGFIYIAGSDLIPELHKETKLSKSIVQLIVFLLGILVMALLVFF